MNTAYDKYYQKEDYFGKPYEGLVSFFKEYDSENSVLDVGCGQGRDAIALAKLGYNVTGIDSSSVGIGQMLESSKREGVELRGIVGDIYSFEFFSEYDIILMDSMLHFYKNDISKETGFVNKILDSMKPNGVLCNCMIKGDKRESLLKKIVRDNPYNFNTLLDDYTEFPEFDARYHILVIIKTG